jgi:hypothetical protein
MICGSTTTAAAACSWRQSRRAASTMSTSYVAQADRKDHENEPRVAQIAVARTAYKAVSGSPSQPRVRPVEPDKFEHLLSQPRDGS